MEEAVPDSAPCMPPYCSLVHGAGKNQCTHCSPRPVGGYTRVVHLWS